MVRRTINFDETTIEVLNKCCVAMHMHYDRLIERAVRTFLKNKGLLQDEMTEKERTEYENAEKYPFGITVVKNGAVVLKG